jgi:type IV pilus assembly protein PilC
LIAVGTTAKNYVLFGFLFLIVLVVAFRYWAKTDRGQERMDRVRLKMPVFGEIWIKYQVAQFSRVLGTLLVGGIPLVQALDTASNSLGTKLLKKVLSKTGQLVKEGQALSVSLKQAKIFPTLAIDMIEVGESTGALPAMLNSVAEFYEEDVQTALGAAMALIEPMILIIMAVFVGGILISLYLPIFSLGSSIH